jgi:hypothetical protein
MTMTGTAKAILGDISTAATKRRSRIRRADRRRMLEEAEDQQTDAFLAAMRASDGLRRQN